ncbi:hypothetical protein DdX_00407 [Ditylenchus destructor]|uniref:Uncharacterized protein n=1 Tax=Ditylenchus destructor TaxID=166010 RepID=A0AAD4RCX1_9BILA|nr:hypothetical protein DdX_00407 [Ditylenchus destructor]
MHPTFLYRPTVSALTTSSLILCMITILLPQGQCVQAEVADLADEDIPIPAEPAYTPQKSEQPSKFSTAELSRADMYKLLYTALLRDKERAQWQPSRLRPIAPLQSRTPLSALRHSTDSSWRMKLAEMPIYEQRRSMKERRAPAPLDHFSEQWGGMMKTMDNLRKPRFG